MDNSNYLKPFQGLDPDTMPHADDPTVPSLLSNEDTRPSNTPSTFYFSPSDDSAEVYSYASSSWIQRTAVPAGGRIVNMPKCYNPNGAPFEGRAACEENARRLRADQKIRAVENSHPPYWSSQVNYVSGSLSNRNGLEWRSLGNSGPDMAAGVQDPVTSADFWLADSNTMNNKVIWINYNATVDGDGLSESRPLRNFASFMRIFRSISTGKGPYLSSSSGYIDCPSLYVVVIGTGTVTETFTNDICLSGTHIIFALSGITDWYLNSVTFNLTNSYCGFRSSTGSACAVHTARMSLSNSYIHYHNNITHFVSSIDNMYCVESKSSIINVSSGCSVNLTNNSGSYQGVLRSYASYIFVSGHLFCSNTSTVNHSYAVDIRGCVVEVGSTGTFSAYVKAYSGVGIFSLVSDFVSSGTLNTSGICSAYGRTSIEYAARCTFGNPSGYPQSEYCIAAEGGMFRIDQSCPVYANAVIPIYKGAIAMFGVAVCTGRAQASWPGSNAWQISNQGVYIQ